MQKDFQTWHRIKENLHQFAKQIFFHKREVWFCSIGVNIGFEQDGKGEDFCKLQKNLCDLITEAF